MGLEGEERRERTGVVKVVGPAGAWNEGTARERRRVRWKMGFFFFLVRSLFPSFLLWKR